MNVQEQIETLEATALLGTHKRQSIELADRIALQLDADERPDLALRLLIRRFLASPHIPETLSQLSTAEAWATSEGETSLALELQLIWCRYVGLKDPEAVPLDVLDQAVDEAQAVGILDAEWRLALAAVHPSKGLVLREEALQYLTGPGQVHDRLLVHLELASDRNKGADILGALSHLEQAYELASAHQDPTQMCVCATRLGLHYIERGLAENAVGYLERALQLAISEDNDLQVIVLATILSTIYLQAGKHEKVEHAADLLLVAGARRANWFAVVDGHILRSSLSLVEGDAPAAIERLVRAIVRLRELVPAAAINLLKGRLAELRHQLGDDVFDQHYRSAVGANQAL